MELGTRWAVGDDPPARIGSAMHDAIRQVEGDLFGFDTSTWRWTLTWLERRPVVTLDDGTVIRLDAQGDVHIETEPTD